MIYLIGGPPRCGKTTLAEALAKKKAIPYFSIDHISSVITPYLEEKDYPILLPLRVARQEVDNDNDVFFTKYSAEEVLDMYLQQAKTLWPGIENFIRYALEDNHDLILEGWQILPSFLQKAFPSGAPEGLNVKFLYKTDVQAIYSGLKANKRENDWVLKNTRKEESFYAIAKAISHFGNYIHKDAQKHGLMSINMDVDFKNQIARLTL